MLLSRLKLVPINKVHSFSFQKVLFLNKFFSTEKASFDKLRKTLDTIQETSFTNGKVEIFTKYLKQLDQDQRKEV